jgi:DNA recombination protein RmuC
MTELQIIIALLVILSLGATIGFLLSKLIGKSDSKLPVDQQKESMKAAFVELARDEIEKIHEAFEQNQKLEDKDKDKLNKLVKDLAEKVQTAKNTWDENTKQLNIDLKSLTKSHTQWAEALSNPGVQGGMAEESLELLLETAGFDEDIHFAMQPREINEDGETLIPDCYVYLPDDGVIVIDSKAPMKHYREAFETDDAEKKATSFNKHAQTYVNYASDLKKRDYTTAINKRTPDHIFMFVPNASVYLAAVESMPDLDNRVRKLGVSIVPPQMLYAALKTVWLTWREKQMSDNMENVQQLVVEFQKRARKFYGDYYIEIGNKLADTVEKYNAGVKSWTSRLGVTLRDIEDKIGTESDRRTETPEMIEEMPMDTDKSEKK